MLKMGAGALWKHKQGLGSIAYGTGKMGARTTMFALRHPLMVAGGVGAVAGAAYGLDMYENQRGQTQSMDSPALTGARMSVNYQQEAMMAAELGQIGGGSIGTYDQMRQQFEPSNWGDSMRSVSGNIASRSRTARFMDSTVGLPQGLHSRRHGS
jgi:hypothetical protein